MNEKCDHCENEAHCNFNVGPLLGRIDTLAGKVDNLIELHRLVIRWLLIVVCIIALGDKAVDLGHRFLVGKAKAATQEGPVHEHKTILAGPDEFETNPLFRENFDSMEHLPGYWDFDPDDLGDDHSGAEGTGSSSPGLDRIT